VFGLQCLNYRRAWIFFRLGLPLGLIEILHDWIFQAITIVAGTFGTVEVAAVGVMINLLLLLTPFLQSFSFATQIRVQIRLGKERPNGAQRSYMVGFGLIMAVAFTVAVLVVVFQDLISHIYSEDKQVDAKVQSMAPLAAMYFFLQAVGFCHSGVMEAIGKGYVSHIATLVCNWAFGMGMLWLLVRVTVTGETAAGDYSPLYVAMGSGSGSGGSGSGVTLTKHHGYDPHGHSDRDHFGRHMLQTGSSEVTSKGTDYYEQGGVKLFVVDNVNVGAVNLLWTCISLGEVLKGVALIAWAHFFLDWPGEVGEVVERLNQMDRDFKNVEIEAGSIDEGGSLYGALDQADPDEADGSSAWATFSRFAEGGGATGEESDPVRSQPQVEL